MLRGAAEEARAPKYAHVERERRFLVDPAARPDLTGCAHILIEDRYIVGTRLRLRRMTDSATGRIVLKLAKKYEADDPTARPMVTAYLDAAEYELLAGLPANPLTKRRYPIETASGLFGIDLFEGALVGLELAEIDAPEAAILAAIAAPPWSLREVSDEPFFQGGHLATLDAASLRAGLARR